MSMKPNYFKIGVFVITAIVLIVAAIVFFGSGLFVTEKKYFETYFNGSVSGLNIGAPIEVRGVRMGQVEKIVFAGDVYNIKKDSESYVPYGSMVLVLASFDSGFCPVNTAMAEMNKNVERLTSLGFRLRLASNILTGQAFLQGEYLDPNLFPVIEVPWEPENCYISSAPSELTTMKQSVDSILRQLEKINTKRISDLIDELLVTVKQAIDNAGVPEISNRIQVLLTDTDQKVADMNMTAISDNIQSLLTEARQTNLQIQELIKNPEKTESEMANIAVLINNLNRTLTHIDKLVMNQSPKIEQTLEDLRDVSSDLKEIIGDIKKNPSQLIFSQPPPKSEVLK
ncbi:MAG: MCE family protein [Sedimentisphaerales bacterium]|nr:MCE family protein [Sedimentisphaerales bacterium]